MLRTPLVLLPLVASLGAAGWYGASLLWAEVPPAAQAPDAVRCWDGAQVVDADECGPPTGRAGLEWVFPSFRPADDRCRDALAEQPGLRRPTMWACDVEVSGVPVTLTYSELSGTRPGRIFLQQEYGGAEPTVVEADNGTPVRLEWRRRLPEGAGFAVSVMYVDHPYAVEVRTEERDVREEALRDVVRFRGIATLTTRPS